MTTQLADLMEKMRSVQVEIEAELAKRQQNIYSTRSVEVQASDAANIPCSRSL